MLATVPSACWVLVVAFALDLLLGEPPASLHPVVWIGKLIAPLKRARADRPLPALALGAVYVLVVTCALTLTTWLLLRLLAPWPWLRFCVSAYLVWSCFALRALVDAGKALRLALEEGDLEHARARLAWLCSRDARASAPASSTCR